MRAFAPVLSVLAAGAVLAAPAKPAKPVKPKPKPKPLTAAQKAKAAALAKAAAAKRAKSRAGTQNLSARGVPPSAWPRGGAPDRIGEPFVPAPRPQGGDSELPVARTTGAPLFFSTSSDYDARLDLKPDFVAVQRSGASWEELLRPVVSWKAANYPVYRLLSLGRDPGAFFTSGLADSTAHPDEVERDAAGNPLGDPARPATTLSPAWVSHLKEQIRRSLDAGVDGFVLGDAVLPSAGGYSPAFKRLWEDALKTPWQAPGESPAQYFRAARFRSDLALGAVNDLLRQTRDYAREKGRPASFFVSVPSPLAAGEGAGVFPYAAVSRLPIEGLVGELSLADARVPMVYEGQAAAAPFEYSWLTSSYFAHLVEGLNDRSLLLSVSAGARDSRFPWSDYESWYRQTLAAALVFPQVRGFEAYPWPEVTHMPGEGAAPPPAYLTQLATVAGALKELPAESVSSYSGTRGIGVLALDSLTWQQGGPGGSSMRSLQGLTLPLLKRGVPVQMVPAERVADAGFLSKFRILLLSFDTQKPLGPELSQALAQWVRGGGTLLLLGGEDPYNTIGEWWEKNGYASPADHLLRLCGVGVDLVQRNVRRGSYKTVLEAAPQPQTTTVVLKPEIQPGKAVYLRFQDRTPETGSGLRLGRVRVLEGGRVRADFPAGGAAERPFLAEESGSRAAEGGRVADGGASFTYRFNRLGEDARVELEIGGDFLVSSASGADPGTVLKPAVAPLPAVRVPSTSPVVTYPLAGAQALYTTGEGAGEAAPAWISSVGQGSVLYCGVPAAFAAESASGAELLRSLVRYACGRIGLEYSEGPLVVRRGPFVVAHGLGRTANLEGLYLDLFKPDFPLVQNPQLPYREPGLYRQVKLASRLPTVLFGTHRVRTLESNAARTRLVLDGPTGTEGFLRLYSAGMSLTGVEARATDGQLVPIDVRPDGKTIKIRYPQQARGLNLTLRWIRPEARLTK